MLRLGVFLFIWQPLGPKRRDCATAGMSFSRPASPSFFGGLGTEEGRQKERRNKHAMGTAGTGGRERGGNKEEGGPNQKGAIREGEEERRGRKERETETEKSEGMQP